MHRNPQFLSLGLQVSGPKCYDRCLEFSPLPCQDVETIPSTKQVSSSKRTTRPINSSSSSSSSSSSGRGDVKLAPEKRRRIRGNPQTRAFGQYIKLISRETGLNIDWTYPAAILILSDILNNDDDSVQDKVFLDCTSMFSYLATVLGINSPTVSFLSFVNIHSSPYHQSDFIKQSRRLREIALPTSSWANDVFIVTRPPTPRDINMILTTKKSTKGITHLYAHLKQHESNTDIQAYLHHFTVMPSLTTVIFLSKQNTMKDISVIYRPTIRKIGQQQGDFGGIFYLYIFSREDYERVHVRPIIVAPVRPAPVIDVIQVIDDDDVDDVPLSSSSSSSSLIDDASFPSFPSPSSECPDDHDSFMLMIDNLH